jgi:hypothetical protein
MAEPYIFTVSDFPQFPQLPDSTILRLPFSSDDRKMKIMTLEKDGLIFSIAESTPAPERGVNPHVHHAVHEWFYAPEGGLTLFVSANKHFDKNSPPSKEKGTQDTLYMIPLEAGQGVFGPANYIHCFVNHDKVERPLRTLFIADPTIPSPYPDGGLRAMFEVMSGHISGTRRYSAISEKPRENMNLADLEYDTNHSFWFFNYINGVTSTLPKSLKTINDPPDLIQLLDIINEFKGGNTSITCY